MRVCYGRLQQGLGCRKALRPAFAYVSHDGARAPGASASCRRRTGGDSAVAP